MKGHIKKRVAITLRRRERLAHRRYFAAIVVVKRRRRVPIFTGLAAHLILSS